LRPGETPGGGLSGHLQESALDAGLVNMKRPTRRPNSLKVLQAIHHAKLLDPDEGIALRDAFYVAYWDEGKDVGRPEVIRELVEAQAIEWGPVEEALAENRHLDAVMGEYQEGHDLGFDGIPAFVIGDVKFTGAQPMELFRQLAERAKGMLDADPESFSKAHRVL
jgi:predicted DsbA family dithiol-disulfide isomerase